MNIQLIDLKAQYNTLSQELNKAVLDVLSSANYIMGKSVLEFEREFAEYLGVKHAISVGNGTDALVIALKAMGIGEGDEVITSTFTFFATAESISAIGAVPVFIDVDKNTFNIDVKQIEDKITEKTKAIMPVHIFGQPVEMDKVIEIAERHSLLVIEDACQAIGSEYKGKKVGTLGDIACFSFFPTKNLGCAGDGGMIATNNDSIAAIAKALRTHGSGENGQKAYNLLNNIQEEIVKDKGGDDTVYNPMKYYNYLIGHNSRLDALQAEMLRVKLKYIDEWNNARIEHAKYYSENLKKTNIIMPYEAEERKHVYHMYILQSEDREGLIAYLKEKGIATGVYYPIPLHLQKVYKNLGYKIGDMPNAEYLSHRTFAIPMYAELSLEQQDYIIEAIKNFKNYFVHESSYVDEPVKIGKGTKIWHFSHIMKDSKIGENCNIGQNVVISTGVELGNGVKIQNNVSVYTGVICEEGVFLGPSCVFTNVINPRSFVERKTEYRPTVIKKGASIGANSTIVCGNTIGKYALIGAGSVITKDVPDYALVFGNPGKVKGHVCKCGNKLIFDDAGIAECIACNEKYYKDEQGNVNGEES